MTINFTPHSPLPVLKSTDPLDLQSITATSGLTPYCSYLPKPFMETTELWPPSPPHAILPWFAVKALYRKGDLSVSIFLTWKELSSQNSEPNFHLLCLLEQYAVLSRVDKNQRLSLHYAHQMTEK